MRPPITTSVPRGWRSLFTGRWHRSSWGVATATLGILLFCNLPGQLVTTISLSNDFPPPSGLFTLFWGIDGNFSYQHGWPLSTVIRPDDRSRAFDKPSVLDCWTVWRNNPQIRPWAIVVNVLLVVSLGLVVGGAFEAWRRVRQSVWQLHIRDVMAIMLTLSIAGAWYAAQQRRHQREQAIVSQPKEKTALGSTPENLPIAEEFGRPLGGITWIRLLLGERLLGFLDRPTAVFVTQNGLPQIGRLQDVQFVLVEGSASNADVRHLSKLPRLVALELYWPAHVERTVELPPMPRLLSLVISGSHRRCVGFERLSSLDALNLSGCYVDAAMLDDIARMPRLRRLDISGTDLAPGGLTRLRALHTLEELVFDGRERNTATMKELGGFTNLKRLSLRSARLPPHSIGRLATLEHLEVLCLDDSDLRSDKNRSAHWWSDLMSGAAWKTRLGTEAISDLKRLKQLRILSLGKATLSQDEIDALKSALPNCDVRMSER